jgi:hypothetical protein
MNRLSGVFPYWDKATPRVNSFGAWFGGWDDSRLYVEDPRPGEVWHRGIRWQYEDGMVLWSNGEVFLPSCEDSPLTAARPEWYVAAGPRAYWRAPDREYVG